MFTIDGVDYFEFPEIHVSGIDSCAGCAFIGRFGIWCLDNFYISGTDEIYCAEHSCVFAVDKDAYLAALVRVRLGIEEGLE